MKLSKLFNITYGNRKHNSKNSCTQGNIPLASSKGTNNGIHGYYNIKPRLNKCITVPRTGSICEASYHNYPMDADDNCLVMTPKKELTDIEMIWYAVICRKLKPFYFYGRQVTPTRLGNTVVLDKIPEWVYDINLDEYKIKPILLKNKPKNILSKEKKLFKVTDLFDIKKGKGPSLREAKENPGDIPFITATERNNGASCYTSASGKHKGNCLTVACNGSIGCTFYQDKPFCGTSDIHVLNPKFELTEYRAMFLIPLFEAHKFKYNYGRKWNMERMKNTTIMLPAKDDKVDWEYIDTLVKELVE